MYKRISRNKEEFSRLVERVYKKPSIPDHQTAQQSSATYPACHLDCVVFVRGTEWYVESSVRQRV